MHMQRDENGTTPPSISEPESQVKKKQSMHSSIQQAGESHPKQSSSSVSASASYGVIFGHLLIFILIQLALSHPSLSFCGVYHICTMLALLAIYRHRRYLLACMIQIDLFSFLFFFSFQICLILCYYFLCLE
jgi:Flp pilus assembly protein TadB